MKHIAVDLDGTLAYYSRNNDGIGPPIHHMLQQVKNWIADGHVVWIFTARLSGNDYADQYGKISLWLNENGIGDCEITNIKRREFVEFWDDKAYNVERNQGRVCKCVTRKTDWRGPLQEYDDTAY